MKIEWFGQSCFLLTSEAGTKVVTDPYDAGTGYGKLSLEADVVTVSHNHSDHNNTAAVKGTPRIIDRQGGCSVKDIRISGILTFHDNTGGSKRGINIVFVMDMDGLRICHCGDLGHIPSGEQLERIGKVDVLLLPVGGVYTVDAAGAAEIAGLIKPSVTIPMHFKTPGLIYGIDGVEKFIAAMGGERAGSREVEVTADNLAALPKVLVLDYR